MKVRLIEVEMNVESRNHTVVASCETLPTDAKDGDLLAMVKRLRSHLAKKKKQILSRRPEDPLSRARPSTRILRKMQPENEKW